MNATACLTPSSFGSHPLTEIPGALAKGACLRISNCLWELLNPKFLHKNWLGTHLYCMNSPASKQLVCYKRDIRVFPNETQTGGSPVAREFFYALGR